MRAVAVVVAVDAVVSVVAVAASAAVTVALSVAVAVLPVAAVTRTLPSTPVTSLPSLAWAANRLPHDVVSASLYP